MRYDLFHDLSPFDAAALGGYGRFATKYQGLNRNGERIPRRLLRGASILTGGRKWCGCEQNLCLGLMLNIA